MKTVCLHRLLPAVFFCILCLFYVTKSREPPLFPSKKDIFSAVCNTTANLKNLNPDLPVIYFVTPTFSRREQAAELIRLGQTLLHVPNLVWIVAEDGKECSPMVQSFLRRLTIPSVHIVSPMPKLYEKVYYKPRGVSSRNAALDWIAENANADERESVVYFADDDNTYDLRLFEEIRWTKRISMFPVGLIGDQGISSPIVRDGKVIGFTDPWFQKRVFPVDMAGFAFNARLLEESGQARMPYKAGHEEDLFLRAIKLEMGDIEPKARDCTEVLVWHTQSVRSKIPAVKTAALDQQSSLVELIRDLESQGVVTISDGGSKIPVCLVSSCD